MLVLPVLQVKIALITITNFLLRLTMTSAMPDSVQQAVLMKSQFVAKDNIAVKG
jgi:hypothetical protein